MKRLTAEWILKAVEAIGSGLAQKLEKDGVTVYSCGKIIRIDIKDSVKVESIEGAEDPSHDTTGPRGRYTAWENNPDDLPWY